MDFEYVMTLDAEPDQEFTRRWLAEHC